MIAGMACLAGSTAAVESPLDVDQTPTPIATDASGNALPEAAILGLGSVRFRHPGTVYQLALSPDEKTVVTMGDKLIAWDAATGKQRWRADMDAHDVMFNGVSYGMRLLAFEPDGRRVITPGPPDTVFAWDVMTGERTAISLGKAPLQRGAVFNWGRGGPRAVDVSQDGRKLAVGGADGVFVGDFNGRKLFVVENAPAKAVDFDEANRDRLTFGGHAASGQFSPAGKLLAVVASDAPNEIRLHDAISGAELRRIAAQARVVRLAFSPDGRQMAVTERDSSVRCYAVETGERLWSHTVKLTDPFENYTSALAYAPDGGAIAVCATDERIYLLNAATGDQTGVLESHSWNPWAVAFTRDGAMLYSSGWDGNVYRWDVAKREKIPLPGEIRATGVTAISPNGRRIAYEDDGGAIHLVDAADGQELRTLQLPGTQYSQVAFSRDSQRLAGGGTSGDDVHVAVWDLATGEVLHRWDWPQGRDPHSRVEAIAFGPDGRQLAAAMFRQDAVRWWNLDSGQQVAQHDHQEIYGLAFSPDGQTLTTVGWDSTIRLWNASTGELSSEINLVPDEQDAGGGVFRDEDLRMYAVAYAPQGGLIATQHMNGEIWVWDAATMKHRTKLPVGGSFHFGSLSFSPDGLWIASGKSSGELSLWDARSGKAVWNAGKHQDTVYVTSFGRDSRTLLSGGQDGACYLWSLAPPAPHPSADVETLWREMASSEGPDAYRAMWALAATPDQTIELINGKLAGVDALVDLEAANDEVTPEEASRVHRLKRLLVERDPSVESQTAARRAIALLGQFEEPAAAALLEKLAAAKPADDLARLAGEALARRNAAGE